MTWAGWWPEFSLSCGDALLALRCFGGLTSDEEASVVLGPLYEVYAYGEAMVRCDEVRRRCDFREGAGVKWLVSVSASVTQMERSGALAAARLGSGREDSSNALRGSGSNSVGSIIRGTTIPFGGSGRLGVATCTG